MWLTNVIFEDRVIENERLELSDKDALYFLGQNLTLRHCTLVLRVPAQRLHVNRVKLIDCTIEVKKELKNFRWCHAFLKGCKFTGRLTGCDFGQWPDSPEEGGIEGCDFSAAQLQGCRFIGCDVSTLRFPSWPCFTILDPVRRLDELSKVPWPGQVGILVKTLSASPPETAAVTISATVFGKRFGASEDDIKAALKKLDGVKY
jgi:hypothetical protein